MEIRFNDSLVEAETFQLYPDRIKLQLSPPVTKQMLTFKQRFSSYQSSDVYPLYISGSFVEIEWTDPFVKGRSR